jgi:hypothetical protein
MMDSSAMWNSQDPTLSVPSQDDFQFLDMGINNLNDPLQFEYQDFTELQGQDTTMQEHMPSMTTASSQPSISGAPLNGHPSHNDSLVELDAQIQYLQHQRHQQQQRQIQEQQRNYYAQNRMIPPTPNSVEMQGTTSQFYPQSDSQQQAVFERFRMQVKEQEVSLLTLSKIHLTNSTTDGLHPIGITRRHTIRGTLQHPRIYGSWRLFQPFELSGIACTE